MQKSVKIVLALAGLALLQSPAFGDGERAGDFDYYVLALSWSPNWCAREGNARNAEQCDRDLGWSLHGLWPQYETGWPSYCRTSARDPSRGETAAMTDIMGSGGLAWHQWKKHGRCSGESAERYFTLSRQAYQSISRPDVFRKLDQSVRLPARVVEEAFIAENQDIDPDMLTVTCADGMIAEVRICLEKGSLNPRICGEDVRRDCRAEQAVFEPIN